MATKSTPPAGCRQVNLELPIELLEQVIELAERNSRRMKDEFVHALQRHLAAPPVVRIETPELGPAEVVERPRRRGGQSPKR